VIDDRGINDSWISRMKELRRRVRSRVDQKGTKRVMLTRGTLGAKRNLVNFPEVREALDKLGFEIVNPESETPQSIVEKLSGVEIVIAVEGSAQSHCWVAMPSRSTFVAIQPPTRFNANGKDRADALGINWAFIIADPHPDGFYLPIEHFLRTIDEVVRVAGTRA
jgi:capsular polysaccharide biosynthesis protein